MTTAAEFQAKTAKSVTNMNRLDLFVNGNIAATVSTDSGVIPSLSKVVEDIQAALEGGSIAGIPGLTAALNERGVSVGPTANAAQVQAVIDALPATGGVVLIPAMLTVSDIRINGTARDKSNVILRGLGWGTGFKVPNGAMTTLTRVNLIDGEGAVGCRIENMTLDGNRANQTIPVLVDGEDYEKFNGAYFEAAEDCVVRGCNVINMPVLGICLGAPWVGKTGADRCRVDFCTFTNCKVPVTGMRQRRNTISHNTVDGAVSDYCLLLDEYSVGCAMHNNDVKNAVVAGYYAFRASGNQIQNNAATDCEVSYLFSDASCDNLVTGNKGTNAGNAHIKQVNGCLRNTFADNDLDGAGQYCIYSEDGTGGSGYAKITGNRCRGAGYSNIALEDCAFAVVADNYCWDADGSGIILSGACDWTRLSKNYCFNNAQASAVDAGIRLIGQNNITLDDNKCFDSQGVKTQNWGIRCNESFSGTVTFTGNDVRFNELAGMAVSGGTAIYHRNDGWTTENSGVTTLGAASTAVTISHGLAVTPPRQNVRVNFYDATVKASKVAYVSNVGATTFEVRVDAAPGSDTELTWEARVSV